MDKIKFTYNIKDYTEQFIAFDRPVPDDIWNKIKGPYIYHESGKPSYTSLVQKIWVIRATEISVNSLLSNAKDKDGSTTTVFNPITKTREGPKSCKDHYKCEQYLTRLLEGDECHGCRQYLGTSKILEEDVELFKNDERFEFVKIGYCKTRTGFKETDLRYISFDESVIKKNMEEYKAKGEAASKTRKFRNTVCIGCAFAQILDKKIECKLGEYYCIQDGAKELTPKYRVSNVDLKIWLDKRIEKSDIRFKDLELLIDSLDQTEVRDENKRQKDKVFNVLPFMARSYQNCKINKLGKKHVLKLGDDLLALQGKPWITIEEPHKPRIPKAISPMTDNKKDAMRCLWLIIHFISGNAHCITGYTRCGMGGGTSYIESIEYLPVTEKLQINMEQKSVWANDMKIESLNTLLVFYSIREYLREIIQTELGIKKGD